MFKKICIIGAGNIGSRHLQALAKVTQPLLIQVVDPSPASLELAKKMYREVQTIHSKHQVNYLQNLKNIIPQIDIAIIATTSDIRAKVTKQLLEKSEVNCIIFEKLLFDKKGDYEKIGKLLEEKKSKAWVNCSMRTTPFYSNLKNHFKDKTITFMVNGSAHGLITNAIHYIDYIAYLTNCYDFTIDTSLLDKKPIESKRKGFLELNGTLTVYFKDGSFGSFTCYSTGDSPFTIEIISEKYRLLISVLENKSLVASSKSNWNWKIKSTPIAYQSQMTNHVITSLLNTGSCPLTPFDISVNMHLNLLESIINFLNIHSDKKFDYYPFT